MALPVNVYNASTVREMDRRAMDEHGLGDGRLMERAGNAAFTVVQNTWPEAQRIAIIAGPGNNGGDGYVLAHRALRHGLQATVFAVRDPRSSDAVQAAAAFQKAGGRIEKTVSLASFDPDVIVDALLGTGIDRPLEGDFAGAVKAINAAASCCLAIDIPSGLNADTGAVMGCAVVATATVTFIGMKAGLVTGRARALVGDLQFTDLAVPADIAHGLEPAARCVTDLDLQAAFAPRERDAHKGRFGHVLVLGGDDGMPGAVRLAAEASLRTGAGRVSVYTQPSHLMAVVATRPEIMCRAGSGLNSLVDNASVIAVGPGLGQDEFGRKLLAVAMQSTAPLVVDADALNLLANERRARGNWILTPHPGEAARLLGCTVAQIEADRYSAARRLSENYAATVVLKGAGTVIAAADQTLALVDRGNPGMATAGVGDVLTGVVAAVRGQLDSNFAAACAGAYVHAIAGDRAAGSGERGLVAGDVIDELRAVINPPQRMPRR